jgi:hypothetical protein
MPRWHLKISRDIRACSVGIEARREDGKTDTDADHEVRCPPAA